MPFFFALKFYNDKKIYKKTRLNCYALKSSKNFIQIIIIYKLISKKLIFLRNLLKIQYKKLKSE